jgi:hypothetical protein
MRALRIVGLAGASFALIWLAPLAAGVLGATFFVTGVAIGILGLGLIAARAMETIAEPTARPMGRLERCRLCHARRLPLAGLWVCPVCDFADPEELRIDPRHRGGTATR